MAKAAIGAQGGGAWEDDQLKPVRDRMKTYRKAYQKLRCCYCRQETPQQHGSAWTLDHVLSRYNHSIFTYDIRNIFLCCHDCNGIKSTKPVYARLGNPKRYPRSGAAFTIIHPELDSYEEHMLICFEKYYVPLTLKGVHTMSVCGLSRYNGRLDIDADMTSRTIQMAVTTLSTAKSDSEKLQAMLGVGMLIQRCLTSAGF